MYVFPQCNLRQVRNYDFNHWIHKEFGNCKRYSVLTRFSNLKFYSTSCRFLKSPAAEEACEYLTKALGTNPFLQNELDLSRIELGVLGGEKLAALLKDSHSKVEKIK